MMIRVEKRRILRQGLRFDEEALPHNAAELFIAANLIRGNGSQVQDDVSLTEAVNVER